MEGSVVSRERSAVVSRAVVNHPVVGCASPALKMSRTLGSKVVSAWSKFVSAFGISMFFQPIFDMAFSKHVFFSICSS